MRLRHIAPKTMTSPCSASALWRKRAVRTSAGAATGGLRDLTRNGAMAIRRLLVAGLLLLLLAIPSGNHKAARNLRSAVPGR